MNGKENTNTKDTNTKDSEMNPTARLQEICSILKDYEFEVHKAGEADYEYLKEDSVCITILNPYADRKLYIDLDSEFTLSFHAFHSHYDASQEEYEFMMEQLREILSNHMGVAGIYYGAEKNWLGSTCISKEEMQIRSVKDIFYHVYKTKEFKRKLKEYGGEVQYRFWNPADDQTITIPQSKAESE